MINKVIIHELQAYFLIEKLKLNRFELIYYGNFLGLKRADNSIVYVEITTTSATNWMLRFRPTFIFLLTFYISSFLFIVLTGMLIFNKIDLVTFMIGIAIFAFNTSIQSIFYYFQKKRAKQILSSILRSHSISFELR